MSIFNPAITPHLPRDPYRKYPELVDKASNLQIKASQLATSFRPSVIEAIANLLTQMNCYYSNLIEGHQTHPIDIDRALKQDFSTDVTKRALQEESKAHIEVEALMLQKIQEDPTINVCSSEFLLWLHQSFYERFPEEFRLVGFPDKKGNPKKIEVQPGKLRDLYVKVGTHIPPEPEEIQSLIDGFAWAYDRKRLHGLEPILAIGASHHRFLWIHPFLDGNGRFARLLSTAFLVQSQVHSQGLWSLNRGLARNSQKYKSLLAEADQERKGDYDGRGSLSEKHLVTLIDFFLDTCLDQINFMNEMLDLKGLLNRIEIYFKIRNAGGFPNQKQLHEQSARMITFTLLHGEVAKKDLQSFINMSESSTRKIMKELLKEGLLIAKSKQSLVHFGLPLHVVNHYFPNLYPESIQPNF
jgi:Fic family protein